MLKKFLIGFTFLSLFSIIFSLVMPVMANENDLVAYFDVELSYTDFPDVAIDIDNQFSDWPNGGNIEVKTISYNVESKYYSDDDTLMLNINGFNYQDKDYVVNINVFNNKDRENAIYTRVVNINGKELNNGYKYELVELVKESPTALDKIYGHHIVVSIDNQERDVYYSIKSEIVDMKSILFFDNAKSSIPTAAGGAGTDYGSGNSYEINENVFNMNRPIYMYYKGEKFLNDKTYEYSLYYTDKEFYNFLGSEDKEAILSGNIRGSVLNTKGLMLKLNNSNNYKQLFYVLVVKDAENVIACIPDFMMLSENPTMTNIEFRTNRNLYLKMSDYNYIATTKTPISIKVGGVGFDNNKKYSVLLFDNLYDGTFYTGNRVEMNQQVIEATGYELNNMLVNFKSKLKKMEIGFQQAIIIDIYDEGKVEIDENGNRIEHSLPLVMNEGHPILINFLDSRDFFEHKANYIIDNTIDIIKNIIENTDIVDFINSIKIKDNGKVKLFDKNGENEVVGNVGTGMKVKVMDEYENSLLDLDAVVKGDVSGDGVISITDLVKVKKHLANVEYLEGVYELGGDITDTGTIGITDLVKIAKDVAKIEEVR